MPSVRGCQRLQPPGWHAGCGSYCRSVQQRPWQSCSHACCPQDYSDTFDPSRTNVDLKDKWRNLCKLAKGERKNRSLRNLLTDDMVTKILKVLQDTEGVVGNTTAADEQAAAEEEE